MDKLALKQISKIYQEGSLALDNINLDINSKEFLVIVGPSGCGKTTLLRIIAGLEKPTKGEIYLDDQYANNISPKDRNVAMVFQDYPLYPNLTVFQNIAFSLKNMRFGIDEIESKINKVAEILSIKDLLNLKPKYLSGGQKQKVSLAKSMVREPRFLLFDEPLANIDASQRTELRLEVLKLYEILDITFIYVTHDQNEAMSLGTKILVMNQGRIEQIGLPKMIYEKPNNLFVASFFSAPQLNLLSGKFVKTAEESLLVYGEHHQYHSVLSEEIKNNLQTVIGKDVYIGIRSENIIADQSSQITGEVTHIEFVGSMYVYYLKVTGFQTEIVMKSEMDSLYSIGKRISIGFDCDDVFLFDQDTEKSIFLFPQFNVVKGIYQNGVFKVANQTLNFSDRFSRTVITSSTNQDIYVHIPVNNLTTTPSSELLTINVIITDIKKHQKINYAYAKIANTDIIVFFETSNHYLINDNVTLFFNEKDIILKDEEGNRIVSKRTISRNITQVKITSDIMKSYAHLGKTKIEINSVDIPDGLYWIELNQAGIEVITKRSTYQDIKKEFQKNKTNHVVIGSAYDEDRIGTKNIIFLKIDGFEDYVTIVVNNNFSVYDYPEVLLSIPKNAITIIDMSR